VSAPRLDLWLLTPEDLQRWSARAWAFVSAEEAQRAAALADPQARARALGRRAFLRQVLGGVLGCEPCDVALGTGPGGKPRLAAGEAHFNLSESGGWALLGVSQAPLGVDLELVAEAPDIEVLWRRHFGTAEAAPLGALPPEERQAQGLRRWTRLEALLKLDGRGLAALEDAGAAWAAGRYRAWVLQLELGPELAASAAMAEAPRQWALWPGPGPDEDRPDLETPSLQQRG
jgi:4'-phosphopantetheinyl transferase